jgi:D-aminopeptidase
MKSQPNRRKPRARDLGIAFDGHPGRDNAITDVAGVAVGHVTIVRGHGKLVVGRGPVRTGVTAILPRRSRDVSPLFAGYFSLNGNGEMTGTAWIEESGLLTSPIMVTNTHSVGVVRDTVIHWQIKKKCLLQPWSLPVVAETWDGYLNDTDGFHVKPHHAWQALEAARGGFVAEGNVGGGTGMIGYGWKGGIGTASRKLARNQGGYTLGVLVQLNCGLAHELMIAGVAVGKHLRPGVDGRDRDLGSIIIVAATDAPLLPHQLKRVARRLSMGLARTGSVSGNGSGDLFLAFSTANLGRSRAPGAVTHAAMLDNWRMDPIFAAAVQATEEAIVNALVAGETMVGIDGHRIPGIGHDQLCEVMRRYQRLGPPRLTAAAGFAAESER